MQWLVNFFEGFRQAFELAFQFLKSLIDGVAHLVSIIPKAVGYLTATTAFLPSFMVAFVTISLTVYIIFQIIGRESGST